MKFRIGVVVESFGLGIKKGINRSAEIGMEGIQFYATHGDTAPESLGRSGVRDLSHLVRSRNLVISAICADFGYGFGDESKVDLVVNKTKKIVDLAVDMGVSVVTTHIGTIPDDKSNKVWSTMMESLREVGTYGVERGIFLASETGPEEGALLRDFLGDLDCEGIKVNYDPANLVMHGFDCVKGVRDLAGYIVHTHAKDGMSPREDKEGFEEVPLGEGDVPWKEYMAAMEEVEYAGFFTIEREVGSDPASDIINGKAFLESFR